MSKFTTRNGLDVTCTDPTCICNAKIRTVTKGALAAEAEERWFAELDDAMQDYLNLYARYIEASKSDREILEVRVHEAKRDVIDRFYKKEAGL